MMLQGFLPIILILFVIYLAFRTGRAEVTIQSRVAEPPRCGNCKHEATLSMLASTRCPECGSLYLVAGIDGPYRRIKDHNADTGIFAVLLIVGLATAGAVVLLIQPWWKPANDLLWGFLIGAVVFMFFGIVPGVLLWLRRRKIMARVLREMAPPPAPAFSLTTPHSSSL
jgi:DNA-directed RNA polymerase subunit RPC12/RpoP